MVRQDRARDEFTPQEIAYLRQHRQELEAKVDEGRFDYWILAVAFVAGLVAHGLGYALRSGASGEPIAFLADLVYGLGLALWTGTVVALFVQVLPAIKRRQIKRYLRAFDERSKVSRAGR
jgi:hypothetical protein